MPGNGKATSNDAHWLAWISTAYLHAELLSAVQDIEASPVTDGIRKALGCAADELAPELNKLRTYLDGGAG